MAQRGIGLLLGHCNLAIRSRTMTDISKDFAPSCSLRPTAIVGHSESGSCVSPSGGSRG